MNDFVEVLNSGDTPVLVGDRYVFPGQRRRVLRRYFEAAKKKHSSLILHGEDALTEGEDALTEGEDKPPPKESDKEA